MSDFKNCTVTVFVAHVLCMNCLSRAVCCSSISFRPFQCFAPTLTKSASSVTRFRRPFMSWLFQASSQRMRSFPSDISHPRRSYCSFAPPACAAIVIAEQEMLNRKDGKLGVARQRMLFRGEFLGGKLLRYQ